MNIVAYFDGFSSPKTHKRAGYCIIIYQDNQVTYEKIEHLNPETTNNQAELEGLKNTLQSILDNHLVQTTLTTLNQETLLSSHPGTIYSHPSITCLGDSKLIVDAFNGKYNFKVKRLNTLLKLTQQLGRKIPNLTVSWVKREQNKAGLLIENSNV